MQSSLSMRAALVLTLILFFSKLEFAAGQEPEYFLDCADCPEMIWIPPGSFYMGSNPSEPRRERTPQSEAENEWPRHEVTLVNSFAVGKYEIARWQFAAFATDAAHDTEGECVTWDFRSGEWGARGTDYTWSEPGFEQGRYHPVVCVSWGDASAYAAWLSERTGQPYRLLSEAEWEYVARAGTQTARNWGDGRADACSHGNVSDLDAVQELKMPMSLDDVFGCRDNYTFTAPVGRFAASLVGTYDMYGNAWEWTQDCFNKGYESAPTDGSAWIGDDCSERIIKGGAWLAPPFAVRSAKRDWVPQTLRSARVGFRVARDLGETVVP